MRPQIVRKALELVKKINVEKSAKIREQEQVIESLNAKLASLESGTLAGSAAGEGALPGHQAGQQQQQPQQQARPGSPGSWHSDDEANTAAPGSGTIAVTPADLARQLAEASERNRALAAQVTDLNLRLEATRAELQLVRSLVSW